MSERDRFVDAYVRITRPTGEQEAEVRKLAGQIYDYRQQPNADPEILYEIAEVCTAVLERDGP